MTEPSDSSTPDLSGTVDADDADVVDRPAKLPVSVAELRKRLGQRQTEPVHVELGLRRVVASRTTDAPVIGEVTVESIERGVTVRGSVTFAWQGECRRCLDETGSTMEVDIDEIFQVGAPEDTDIIDFDGDQIDLLPIVRDAVVFSLPLAPLCRPDCPGPDPDRYPAMSVEQSEEVRRQEHHEELQKHGDPRWSALDQLRFDS